MRLKLDENLGHRGRELLERAGHDVATVPQQALTGATDAELIQRCTAEARALVTLDLDFANRFCESLVRRLEDGHEVGALAQHRPPEADGWLGVMQGR